MRVQELPILGQILIFYQLFLLLKKYPTRGKSPADFHLSEYCCITVLQWEPQGNLSPVITLAKCGPSGFSPTRFVQPSSLVPSLVTIKSMQWFHPRRITVRAVGAIPTASRGPWAASVHSLYIIGLPVAAVHALPGPLCQSSALIPGIRMRGGCLHLAAAVSLPRKWLSDEQTRVATGSAVQKASPPAPGGNSSVVGFMPSSPSPMGQPSLGFPRGPVLAWLLCRACSLTSSRFFPRAPPQQSLSTGPPSLLWGWISRRPEVDLQLCEDSAGFLMRCFSSCIAFFERWGAKVLSSNNYALSPLTTFLEGLSWTLPYVWCSLHISYSLPIFLSKSSALHTLSSSYHHPPAYLQISLEKFACYMNMFLVMSLYSVFYFYLKIKEQNILEVPW